MNTLSDGTDREHMVKYAVAVMKMFKEVNRNDIAFMLTQQFPTQTGFTMRFIVDDAQHILNKEKKIANRVR